MRTVSTERPSALAGMGLQLSEQHRAAQDEQNKRRARIEGQLQPVRDFVARLGNAFRADIDIHIIPTDRYPHIILAVGSHEYLISCNGSKERFGSLNKDIEFGPYTITRITKTHSEEFGRSYPSQRSKEQGYSLTLKAFQKKIEFIMGMHYPHLDKEKVATLISGEQPTIEPAAGQPQPANQ